MTALIFSVAALVTIGSAIRSTWSPCGLSMLASITPLSETGRGNRFRTTATWFVVGSTCGGLTLGLGVAVLAIGAHRLALSTTAIGVVALAAAILAAASDTGMAGFRLPVHHRQVNERWLDHFRPWVYAAGFGWQIGTGLATYITTAAVYLMILLGALGGSPVRAVALGVGFGFVRGLSVLLGRNITTPDGLRAFHRRFVDTGPKVGRIVVACEAAAALAVAWFLSPLLGLGVTAVVAVAGVVGVRRSAAATAAAAASGTCTPLPGSGSGPGSSAGSSAGAGDPEAATAEPSAGVARSQRLRAGSAT